MPEEMDEYKVVLTWEAIYDVTDITDYIEAEFGQIRADCFQDNIKRQMTLNDTQSYTYPNLCIMSSDLSTQNTAHIFIEPISA